MAFTSQGQSSGLHRCGFSAAEVAGFYIVWRPEVKTTPLDVTSRCCTMRNQLVGTASNCLSINGEEGSEVAAYR